MLSVERYKMRRSMAWLKKNRPGCALIQVYEMCLFKGAELSLDTMWRLYYKEQFYDANSLGGVMEILICH